MYEDPECWRLVRPADEISARKSHSLTMCIGPVCLRVIAICMQVHWRVLAGTKEQCLGRYSRPVRVLSQVAGLLPA